MSSYIVEGKVWHARLAQARHTFEYPMYFFELDVDHLSELERQCFVFGLNRWNILALRERDYLKPTQNALRDKTDELLREAGLPAPASIRLVTQLRYWGWVFNPVSFFFCFDAAGNLTAVIADVNNTFGEGHAYVLTQFHLMRPDCYEARAPKVFHVSPFFERKGEYRFEFDLSKPNAVNIILDYYEKGVLQLASSWRGGKQPFRSGTVISVL